MKVPYADAFYVDVRYDVIILDINFNKLSKESKWNVEYATYLLNQYLLRKVFQQFMKLSKKPAKTK